MSSKLNHHFVPKYLFRLHNGKAANIHLLRRSSGDVIWNASIRGQCARHKYYGSEEFEDWLERLDSLHADAFRAVVRNAWEYPQRLTVRQITSLYQSVMLQRARVPRTAESNAAWMNETSMYVFRELAKHLPDEDMRSQTLKAIEGGEVQFEGFDFEALMHSILTLVRGSVGILDLRILIVRNKTDYPFFFGDCPCIFCNPRLYEWRDQGVIGIRTPGLIIIHPIHPKTLLMLYDADSYSITHSVGFVDVFTKADVSQFNALQLHSAIENIYFYDPNSLEYLLDLYAAHRTTFQNNFGELRIHPAGHLVVSGNASSDEAIHVFERQLPHRLDLSFVQTAEPPQDRSLALSRGSALDAILAKQMDSPSGSVRVEDIVRELESRIS